MPRWLTNTNRNGAETPFQHPSEQDSGLAKKVVNAASILDISLLDFLIIGENKDKYYSFLGEGLM